MPRIGEFAINGIKCRNLEFLGFPDYAVGVDGVVWSKRTKGGGYSEWHKMKLFPSRDGKGYLDAQVCNAPNRKYFKVSHLVLFAFVGPKPFPEAQGRHLNDIKSDNSLENLEWGTQSQNMQDLKRNGKFPDRKGERNSQAKLTEKQVREIRRLYIPRHLRTSDKLDRKGKRNREDYLKYSMKNLAKIFGVSISAISFIVCKTNNRWANVQ